MNFSRARQIIFIHIRVDQNNVVRKSSTFANHVKHGMLYVQRLAAKTIEAGCGTVADCEPRKSPS
jgi:hypothetical protein